MSKGRAAIAKQRRGPPVAYLPSTNFVLPDGRTLHYAGRVQLGELPAGRWNTLDGMLVLGSMDHTPHGLLLHLSCSYHDKDPSWAELKAIKAAFYGDRIDAAMILPKAEDYVNEHPHCFHFWQLPVAWGIQ
jgi:hypothetical protein